MPDRQALCGILFALHTSTWWEYPPQELDFGAGKRRDDIHEAFLGPATCLVTH
ncbi:hypothetical protein [Streptomyces sp. cmx-4-7]|uniref:hypothetical protein n=1 Tax=Streptomyces sp. cmx-4-7 TaxID=2790939 RepID=UPI00398023D5